MKLREILNIIVDTLEFLACRMSTFKKRVQLVMHSQKWDSEKVSISLKFGLMIVEFFKLRAEYLSLEQRVKWECNAYSSEHLKVLLSRFERTVTIGENEIHQLRTMDICSDSGMDEV